MKWSEVKASAKAKAKKVCNWVDNNFETIVGVAGALVVGIGVPVASVVLGYKICGTTPVDIVKFKKNDGWLLLDAYEPNLYWPTIHGLNEDELGQVASLIVNENISTGEALLRLGLLRSNY